MADLLNQLRRANPAPASVPSRDRSPLLSHPVLSHRLTAPLLIGLLGLTISLVGIGVPSIWYDEAATVTAATRSWAQLWQMLGNVDAVHAVHYFVIHALVDIFGYSPVLIRLPSAVAVGVAGALTVVLTRQFTSARAAVLAGFVFCLLPRTTWMGTEARSYAISAALAVLLTIVLVRAVRADSPRWWAVYAAVAVASTLVFIYLALIVVAHGFTMGWWLWSRRGEAIAQVRRWFVASAAAAVLLVPFVVVVASQSGQLSWISPLSTRTVRQVFQTQWFYYSPEFAIAGWLLLVFGAVVLVRRSGIGEIAPPRPPGFPLAAVVLPILTVPTVVLLIATAVYSPLYTPRYLVMCIPFVAIAMAMGVAAIRPRPIAAATILSLVVLAVPQIVEQRQPEAKQDSSWSQVADLMARERGEIERAGLDAGDIAIVYGPVRYHPLATSRVIAYTYPEPFEGTVDVTLRTPAAETAELWETRGRLGDSLDRLEGTKVAYLITSIKRDRRAATTETLAPVGFSLVESWSFTDVNVLKYERD